MSAQTQNSSQNSSSNGSQVYVHLEFTPNPNTLKYSVNRPLLEKGALNFTKKEQAEGKSPLAVKLFDIPGLAAVMIGRDFVTVTKADEGDWDTVHKMTSEMVRDMLASGQPVVTSTGGEEAHKGGTSEVERKIQEILDNEIRPAVAMDGGDITFDRYEAGVVYLYLKGSCAGCPSATMTLKMGIEERLKKAIPEVLEVVSV